MATIKDIAQVAGVSKAAVSYAFNGSNKISETTREKILKIASELNYTPNRNAQRLRAKQTKRIGLFLPFFSGSYYMYLCESIFRMLQLSEYKLEIYTSSVNTVSEQIAEVIGAGIDAAIVQYSFHSSSDFDKFISATQKSGIPVVCLTNDRVFDKCSCVVMDNERCLSQTVDYLIETGHRKIMYFGNGLNYDESKRFLGFSKAMTRHDLTPLHMEFLGTDPCEWAGYQTIHDKFPQLTEIPDAICCENDLLAIGCIRALRSFGYKIPNDISITGFDNLIPSQLFDTKLTTVKNPIERIGRLAAEEALRLIDNEAKGKIIVVDSELVKGETVAVRSIKE